MSTTEFPSICPECGERYLDYCKNCATEEKSKSKSKEKKEPYITFESIITTLVLVGGVSVPFLYCWLMVTYPKFTLGLTILIGLGLLWCIHKLDQSIKKYEKEKAQKYRKP
jgi:protein-S-isoprenylcysteine O-methyltransferase Ste14